MEKQTLAVIAAELGIPVEALRIEAKLEGRPAVFYDLDGAQLCVCAVDSQHWQQARAKAQAVAVIDRALRGFSR